MGKLMGRAESPLQQKYFVPFFKWQGLTNYVGFGPDNRLYTWYYDEPNKAQLLDQSFFDFILNQTKELMENKEKIKNGDNSKK